MRQLRLTREPVRNSLRENLVRYGWAILFTLAALVFADLFDQHVHRRITFIFLMAVVLSAYYGGLGPGLLAAVVSIFLADYFFIAPVGSVLRDVDDVFLLVMFLVISVFISWIESTRARSQQELEEVNLELETILQGVGDGIAVRNANGEIVFANEMAAQLLGFESLDEMTASTFDDWASRVEMRALDGTLLPLSLFPGRRVLVEGIGNELTFQLRLLKTGEQRWLNVTSTPIFGAHGELRRAVKIVRDFTAQRKAEEVRMGLLLTIDQQRQRIQTILDNVPGIVWESENRPKGQPGQKTTFISAYAPVLLGYDVDQWLGDQDFWRRDHSPGGLGIGSPAGGGHLRGPAGGQARISRHRAGRAGHSCGGAHDDSVGRERPAGPDVRHDVGHHRAA